MASKKGLEVYKKLVDAQIGELIPMRYERGKDCRCEVIDLLKQSGHLAGREYEEVFNWQTCETSIKKLNNIKDYEQPKHQIKEGDIFYNSWGWEQTNIDFYQVVKATESTVTIRAIRSKIVELDNRILAGKVVPDAGNFSDDKLIRKTPYFILDGWHIPFKYGIGNTWDGKPIRFTGYA